MSSSQQSGDSQQDKNKKNKPPKSIPLMDQCRKIKPKHKQIVINLSMTRYDVIADVAEQLDWHVQYNSKKGDWDIIWIDQMIEPEILIKMHFFQKISHFPGIHVLARKNLLGITLMEMKKKFGSAYSFVPDTWMIPKDFSLFRQQVQKSEKTQQIQKKRCFIVKPQADCQGRGIFLTFKTQEVENGKHYVVQDYIQRPFLVQGLKFDFRVYVLLCGTNPMRLYVYEEGLSRFATQKYQQPNNHNSSNMFMHLTNYAINKKNPRYVYNSSVNNMASGHKRSLTSVFADMKRRGFNIESLKNKLDDVLVKTIIIGVPLISHQYKFCQPDDQYKNMCFHILGIDVMIDQLLNPIVLEVNHTPSFATDTPLDYFIKYNLIKDTLILMNITQKSKKQLIKKTNSYRRERVTNAKRLVQTQQQKQRVKQCQQERDLYEKQHMGRYRKIYPVDNIQAMNQYQEYQLFAQKTYFSDNNWIRVQIEAQRDKQKEKKMNISKLISDKRQKLVQSPQLSSLLKHHNSYSQKTKVQKQYIKRLSPASFRSVIKDQLLQTPLQAFSQCFQVRADSQSRSAIFSSHLKPKVNRQAKKLVSNEQKLDQRIIFPKIEQNTSPTKSFSTNVRKNKYQSLKKRMMGLKDFTALHKIQKSWAQDFSFQGKFVKPKVIQFEDELNKLHFFQK